MSQKAAKIQFNGGELSPWLSGRVDIAKYHQTSKLCRNFIPLTEGALKRRGGTRFVGKTPDVSDLSVLITAVPEEADIYINGIKQNSLTVAAGDTIFYEVKAKGYVSLSGKLTVTQSITLVVELVAEGERKKLQIVSSTTGATIKIAGFERSTYWGIKGEKVVYLVFKDGYKMHRGEVVLDSDKTITVALEEDVAEEVSYGTWGDLTGFAGASVYGDLEAKKKCFLFKFSTGYLPVLFDGLKTAPDATDVDETLFVTTAQSGYNSFCLYGQNQKKLAVVKRNNQGVFYNDLVGNVFVGFDFYSLKFAGWPVDEKNNFITLYNAYDAVLSGDVIKIYFNGNLVWTLRGRNNG